MKFYINNYYNRVFQDTFLLWSNLIRFFTFHFYFANPGASLFTVYVRISQSNAKNKNLQKTDVSHYGHHYNDILLVAR